MIELMRIGLFGIHANAPGTSVYAIVRNLKYKTEGVTQLKTLAPSTMLYHVYCNKVRDGQWDGDAFQDIFVPRFIAGLANSNKAMDLLRDLTRRSNEGEHIILACYCKTEQLCHRSIVGGILEGMGATVRTSTDLSYISYYEQYLQALKH